MADNETLTVESVSSETYGAGVKKTTTIYTAFNYGWWECSECTNPNINKCADGEVVVSDSLNKYRTLPTLSCIKNIILLSVKSFCARFSGNGSSSETFATTSRQSGYSRATSRMSRGVI